MSRDSSTSGIREKPACMASTWGARVNGTSQRSSGRAGAASTVWGRETDITGAEAGGSMSTSGGRGGGAEGALDGSTITLVEGWGLYGVCTFCRSPRVSPIMTNPPSVSLSDDDFLDESLRRKLNML